MKRLKLIFIILFTSFSAYTHSDFASEDIIGTWLVASGDAKVTIFKTGNYFYGKVSWLRNPNNPQGKPKEDEKNPEEKQRSRHIMGLLLLKGFEYNDKDQQWVNGEIYDPKNGKTYSCKITMPDRNTLDVRGFIGISLIGRTDKWTRSE
jgi:uncharacterized protein (DUF2147 family)